MVRVNCFACKEVEVGAYKCTALQKIDCKGCKFYKTKEEYNRSVRPLRHKNSV